MGNAKRLTAGAAALSLVLLGACRSDNDTKSAAGSAAKSTTTTLPTEVLGVTLDATTTSTHTVRSATTAARPSNATSTTPRVETRHGASVTDAPRDPHTQRSDNAGSLEYRAQPTAASSRQNTAPDDPLEFTAVCQVAQDGHGTCRINLINRVTRNAQFPEGLRITITMQRQGGAPLEFVHHLPSVTTLRPGEEAVVDATFDITEQGRYDYFATTTVAWP